MAVKLHSLSQYWHNRRCGSNGYTVFAAIIHHLDAIVVEGVEGTPGATLGSVVQAYVYLGALSIQEGLGSPSCKFRPYVTIWAPQTKMISTSVTCIIAVGKGLRSACLIGWNETMKLLVNDSNH